MFDLEQEALSIDCTAEWRRSKAEEFPEDTRNLEAAELLEELATDLRKLEGSDLHRQIDRITDLDDDALFKWCEQSSEYQRQIGFSKCCPSATAYLADLIETIEPA